MSGANHSANPSPRPGLGDQASSSSSYDGNLELTNKTSASVSSMMESTRQQHDRDFFEKFLRSPAATTTNNQQLLDEMDPNGFLGESGLMTNQTLNQASLIDQLMPLANQSTLPRPSSCLMTPMYSTFGMNLSYQRDGDTSIGSTNTDDHSSTSPFYNNVNLSSDTVANSLFNNLNNQLNTSDSSNIFSGNSNFSTDYSRNLFHTRQSESSGPGKTYSSVVHATSPQIGLNAMHHQHQQQAIDGMSLFNSNHLHHYHQRPSPSIANCEQLMGQASQQSILEPNFINKQYQLMNAPTRFNEFPSGQSNRQNPTFHASIHHHQSQSIKPTSLSGVYHRSTPASGGGSGAPSTGARQVAISTRSQMRNATRDDKMASSNAPSMSGGSGSRRRNKSPFFSVSNYLGEGQPGFKLDAHGTGVVNSDESERFSRKVFVGGLPPDIDEVEIKASFRRFGSLVVDWPHKAESKSYFPPKGYAFLLFQEEASVQSLIDSCFQEEDKLYLCVSSPTIKDKPVQIRPWRLSDSDFVLDSTLTLDPRKTVFVGGVPRPLKASELATIMNNLYGDVCYAGIDTDPELKYPKGAGRVAFSNHKSYIAAISARFVHIHHNEIEKRVEVKPYVLDDQFCDECQGSRCNNKFAPFFCANITCLRYYCDGCWSTVHSHPGKEFHKPLVKEGGDRPRGGGQSFKW